MMKVVNGLGGAAPAPSQGGGDSSNGKISMRRPSNPIPRYKRLAHIDAEYRRRGKIQRGLDMVQSLVPSLQQCSNNAKQSKAAMLAHSSDHIRQLAADCARQKEEKEALLDEISSLQQELQVCQQHLPPSGVNAVHRPSCHAKRMVEEYLQSAIARDWKFWIFSFILRPLSESFLRCVALGNRETFFQSVKDWSDKNMTLVNLRPIVLTLLRSLSTTTSIINDPGKLEEEVHAMMDFDIKPSSQLPALMDCDQQNSWTRTGSKFCHDNGCNMP